MEMAAENNVAANLNSVRTRIAAACQRAGRDPSSITLVAVTKKVPVAEIEVAYHGGQYVFGESYIKEAEEKIPILRRLCPEIRFHLIGRLQTNKLTNAISEFELVQSVSRLREAEIISELAMREGRKQSVLLQVNISGEGAKGGILPEDLENEAQKYLMYPGITVEGLMCIGKWDLPEQARREEFKKMAILRNRLRSMGWGGIAKLSMGMSSDFELAIEEGATIVRVGTAIFGERG